MQKQQIKVNLHKSIVEQISDLRNRYNKSMIELYANMPHTKHTAEEDFISESEAIEYCLIEFETDTNKETIPQIMQMIERMRDAFQEEEKESKSFRLNVDCYDLLTNLKESLNRHNKVYQTYKLEDVIEYLVQSYSLNA